LLVTTLAALKSFAAKMKPMFEESFAPVINVMVAYTVLYYCFLYLQSGTKFYLFNQAKSKEGKVSFSKIKYGSTDKLALMADRSVGNLIEQSIPFLFSLWMCAVFYSPSYAARHGWYWLLSRSYYPFVFYKGLPWILFSTIPGYIIICLLLYPVASTALGTLF
jgi:hypothetical protein